MTFHGHVHNGAIVFDQPLSLPEGAPVRVEVIAGGVAADAQANRDATLPTLAERLHGFVGCLEGLPADAAINHDHYLYGTPKAT